MCVLLRKIICTFLSLIEMKERDTSGFNDRFGLFNGKELVFSESTWGGIATALKMFYRYGFDIFRLQRQTSDMINSFSK